VHTHDRSQYKQIVEEYLNSAEYINSTYAWPTSCKGPAVIFGGGAEQFIAGKGSPNGSDYYEAFQQKGYNVVYNATELNATDNDTKTLGIFSISNMAKWLDRKIYPDALKGLKNSPTGDGSDALDQPGLKDMTIKAIDILQNRAKKNADSGWIMMSEAASIDKVR
jgi:alkaline phosphatase